MSVAKVIELIAEGNSIEEAVDDAARQASKTVRKVRSIYVEGIQAIIKDGDVDKYRVNCKVTFIVD